MPKPVLGNQVAQDTFENLKDQASDVVQGVKDVVSNTDPNKGDSGIEQLGGAKQDDPQKILQQSQKQGLTPQQLAEKRTEEKKQYEFYQAQVHGWDEHYQQVKKEEENKKKQTEEEERQKKQQQIVQLQEQQERAALAGPSKPKPGRGTAFMAQQTKTSGTTELPKPVTN